MATNFKIKIGEICLLAFIHRPESSKRGGILQFWFQKVQWRWSTTSC